MKKVTLTLFVSLKSDLLSLPCLGDTGPDDLTGDVGHEACEEKDADEDDEIRHVSSFRRVNENARPCLVARMLSCEQVP